MNFHWISNFENNQGLFVNLIAGIIILLIGLVVAAIVSKLLKRLLHELEVDKILKEQGGIKVPIEDILSTITKYLIYFIALIMALAQLGLEAVILYIILIVILLILVILIILAFKDFIPNFSAGFFIHQKGMIKKGDYIKINSTEGKVINVGLIETEIETKTGDRIYIPNSILTKNRLIKKKK
jgi:small-conductance mechanosensitive channel